MFKFISIFFTATVIHSQLDLQKARDMILDSRERAVDPDRSADPEPGRVHSVPAAATPSSGIVYMIREMGTPASALPPDGQKNLSEFARTWANLSGRIGLSSSDRELFIEIGQTAVRYYLSAQPPNELKSVLPEVKEETDNCYSYIWAIVCLSLLLSLSALVNGCVFAAYRKYHRMVEQLRHIQMGLAATIDSDPAANSTLRGGIGAGGSISLD